MQYCTWSGLPCTQWKVLLEIPCHQLPQKCCIQIALIQQLSRCYLGQATGRDTIWETESGCTDRPIMPKYITHLLMKPNAIWGNSFILASLLVPWFLKWSGLNSKGSGYTCLLWNIAIKNISGVHSKSAFFLHTKYWPKLCCLLGFDNHYIHHFRCDNVLHPKE